MSCWFFLIRIHLKNPEKSVAVYESQERSAFCRILVEVYNKNKRFCGCDAIKNLCGIGNHAVRLVSDDVGDFTFLENGRGGIQRFGEVEFAGVHNAGKSLVRTASDAWLTAPPDDSRAEPPL